MGQIDSILFVLLLLISTQNFVYVSAFDDMYCNISTEIEDECASYCYTTVKPFLNHINQLHSLIQLGDLGNKILELHEKLQYLSRLEGKIDRLIEGQQEVEKVRKNSAKEISDRLGQFEKTLTDYKESNQEIFLLLKNNDKNYEDVKAQLEELKRFNGRPDSCLKFGNSSEIHTIWSPEIGSLEVRCDSKVAGSNGWLVIQRRFNGEVSFYRNWDNYKYGFGDLSGEFWLGLKKMYYLTKQERYELYVNMKSFDGKITFNRYDDFRIGSEAEGYILKSIGNQSGNGTSNFKYNVGQKFTTIDRQYDNRHGFANERHSGWWHRSCSFVNPNGKYYTYPKDDKDSMHWFNDISLKSIELLIRPVLPSN